jgi:hypothetical protein
MIKSFENFHSEIDPYNEENWDEIEVGDSVICVRGTYDGIRLFKNQQYIVDDIVIFIGEPTIKIKGDDGYWDPSRFKKILNENHNEVDPLGEENWDDDNPFRRGDILTCINSAGSDDILYHGDDYEVLEVHLDGKHVILDIDGCLNRYWNNNRFIRKQLNESHTEIDPFEEEDWNDYDLSNIEIGDIVTCVNDYESNVPRGTENLLKTGKDYEVVDTEKFGLGHEFLKIRGIDKFWAKERFAKKKLNENHIDVDPLGEENWDDDSPKYNGFYQETLDGVFLKKTNESAEFPIPKFKIGDVVYFKGRNAYDSGIIEDDSKAKDNYRNTLWKITDITTYDNSPHKFLRGSSPMYSCKALGDYGKMTGFSRHDNCLSYEPFGFEHSDIDPLGEDNLED